MIRIDLGKDELEKSPSKIQEGIEFLKKFRIRLPQKSSSSTEGSQQKIDPNVVVIIGIALLLAYFPNFVVDRYRENIRDKYKKQEAELNKGLKDIGDQINRYSQFKAELESYEQQKLLVQKRLAVVQELLALRGTPVNVLDTIGQSLPRRTWVRGIVFKNNPKESGVIIRGHSYSNEEISAYVDRLQESVYLEDVRLETVTSGKEERDVDVRVFTILGNGKTGYQMNLSAEDDKKKPSSNNKNKVPPNQNPPRNLATPAAPPKVRPPNSIGGADGT